MKKYNVKNYIRYKEDVKEAIANVSKTVSVVVPSVALLLVI